MLQCGLFRSNFSLAIVFPWRAAFFSRRSKEGLERVAGIEPASSAWKAAALPLCYTRRKLAGPVSPHLVSRRFGRSRSLARGGGSRTRTYEGVRQRIYSPPPLPLGTFPRARLDPEGPKTERVL